MSVTDSVQFGTVRFTPRFFQAESVEVCPESWDMQTEKWAAAWSDDGTASFMLPIRAWESLQAAGNKVPWDE